MSAKGYFPRLAREEHVQGRRRQSSHQTITCGQHSEIHFTMHSSSHTEMIDSLAKNRMSDALHYPLHLPSTYSVTDRRHYELTVISHFITLPPFPFVPVDESNINSSAERKERRLAKGQGMMGGDHTHTVASSVMIFFKCWSANRLLFQRSEQRPKPSPMRQVNLRLYFTSRPCAWTQDFASRLRFTYTRKFSKITFALHG